MCRADVVFFVNSFGWLLEPRERDADLRKIPFITWDAQEELFTLLGETYAVESTGVEKCRDVGATWIHIYDVLHKLLFDPNSTHLLVSAKEENVWNPGAPKALFSKLDFALKMLPSWLLPEIDKRERRYWNTENGAVITGEATVEAVGRSDRVTTAFCDELAHVPKAKKMLTALGAVTNCKRICSTPAGPFGAYYDFIRSVRAKFTFPWTRDPRKTQGLYRANAQAVEYLDAEYDWPPGYEFVRDGTIRSPWLDYQQFVEYANDARGFAQEVLLSYEGSVALFYGSSLVDAIKTDVREPILRGEIKWLTDTYEFRGFTPESNGRWQLWCNPDPQGEMPEDRSYVVAVDISAGTAEGASNSVIVVLDCASGCKAAEFADPHLLPHELAGMAVATCRWFAGADAKAGGAYLIWDATGSVASGFTRSVVGKYGRLHYRKSNEQSRSGKITDVPGFHIDRYTGPALHNELRRQLVEGLYVERSEMTCKELLEYLHTPTGTIEHSRAITTDDPSGAKANHGDRVIATALALRGREEIGASGEGQAELEKRAPESYALRTKRWQERRSRGTNRIRTALNGVMRHGSNN